MKKILPVAFPVILDTTIIHDLGYMLLAHTDANRSDFDSFLTELNQGKVDNDHSDAIHARIATSQNGDYLTIHNDFLVVTSRLNHVGLSTSDVAHIKQITNETKKALSEIDFTLESVIDLKIQVRNYEHIFLSEIKEKISSLSSQSLIFDIEGKDLISEHKINAENGSFTQIISEFSKQIQDISSLNYLIKCTDSKITIIKKQIDELTGTNDKVGSRESGTLLRINSGLEKKVSNLREISNAHRVESFLQEFIFILEDKYDNKIKVQQENLEKADVICTKAFDKIHQFLSEKQSS